MTERIYDSDSNCCSLDATVISCRPHGDLYAVVLDKTIFFPGGGGQEADKGELNALNVVDLIDDGEDIIHIVNGPLSVGLTVNCKINIDRRFRLMQNHTGEHLVCGIAHSLFSAENTGFHMGSEGVTADLSVPLTKDQIITIENKANTAIYENKSVRCFYPSDKDLNTIDYRSKGSTDGRLRLVSIEGYDCCACCAPHVKTTGQIGVIKILSFQRYKGGTRLLIKCGYDAFEDYRLKCNDISIISQLLCSEVKCVSQAVEELLQQKHDLEFDFKRIQLKHADYIKERITYCDGNACFFLSDINSEVARDIVNLGIEKCTGVFAVFYDCKGSYNYCIGSNRVNMREYIKSFNHELNGRGGGRDTMAFGSVGCSEQQIIEYLSPKLIVH